MQIEQAIFTSAQTSRARGYHLVARSPGIDDRLAQQLALWSPSENSLIDRDVDADSLNVFSPDPGWVAISRTVSADAEYSDRGQFRMETNMLVMRRDQLTSYRSNPLAVFRAATASGYLRLRPVLPVTLPSLHMPESLGVMASSYSTSPERPGFPRDVPLLDRPKVDVDSPFSTASAGQAVPMSHSISFLTGRSSGAATCVEHSRAVSEGASTTLGADVVEISAAIDRETALVQEVIDLADQQRLVIVGCDNPTTFLGLLFRTLPIERRLEFSFTTGLKPSTHRPFRLQFLPQVNNDLARELEARGMRCLTIGRRSESSQRATSAPDAAIR